MISQITPVPAYPNSATQLSVNDGRIILGVGADFQYALLDSGDNIVGGPFRNTLTNDQYNGWSGDDTYVMVCIAANVGLTIISS